ncbi:LysM peptidoglycan-binding domain-containing protein [Candidatus Leptofilum sp.]|uniref:LysM peptidoglycan-binding domain-containing protein n=1 Tax=Candidatus Leptofilum sp. TaxID=3241576 RepID=UPI003B59412B
MRKILLFILLLALATVACSQLPGVGGGSDGAEENEVAQDSESPEEEAPRVEVTATPTLPPTFTPEPMGRAGHISPVSTRTLHIVQAGETMSQIAAKYGVDTKFLADSNRIYNYHLIEVGQVLYIPPCE